MSRRERGKAHIGAGPEAPGAGQELADPEIRRRVGQPGPFVAVCDGRGGAR